MIRSVDEEVAVGRVLTMREQVREEIWDRFAAGELPFAIAKDLGRHPFAVHQMLSATGGVRPASRCRSARVLSAAEREEISRGLAAGRPMRSIAAQLARAPSTVSREIARNGGPRRYRACQADRRAWRAAKRPKVAKLAQCPRLRRVVEAKLEKKWSPEQISRWLAMQHPADPEMNVSHETIYLSLFVQGRGALRSELHGALRSGRAMRRPKRQDAGKRGIIPDMVLISERPAEVEDRAVPGHWEGDLIMGTNKSCIGTLVERTTRFTMLMKLERPTAEAVRLAMAKTIRMLPAELARSVTWDRGSEMFQHREFTVATGVQIYFCDPKSPWQRGTNENTNGLLRQYFPKRTSLAGFSQRELNAVARELNERPRKTLGWMSPLEALSEVVASTT
jgi:IS30 family transposase